MKNRFIFAVAIFVATLVAAFFFNKYKVAPAIKFETLDLTDIEERKISALNNSTLKIFQLISLVFIKYFLIRYG